MRTRAIHNIGQRPAPVPYSTRLDLHQPWPNNSTLKNDKYGGNKLEGSSTDLISTIPMLEDLRGMSQQSRNEVSSSPI